MTSCPSHLRLAVHRLFLNNNHDLLHSPTLSEISWYAPESLGGLGLVPIFDSDDLSRMLYGPSPLDLLVCDHLISYPNSQLHRLPTDAPLAVRSLWTSGLPFKRSTTCSYDLDETDIGFLDVSTYYLVPGFLEAGLKDPLLQLSHNRRVWRRLRRRFRTPVPRPFAPMDLD
jgi:hypothetical protein